MGMGRTLLAASSLLACLVSSAAADIAVDGDRLTVTTPNIRVMLRGGEVTGITNRVTGDVVASGTGRGAPITTLRMSDGARRPLRADGWRRGRGERLSALAAQTVLRDGVRTLWLNVRIDEATDDVVIELWAESMETGVAGAALGVRNLDLSTGSLIVPTGHGEERNAGTLQNRHVWHYPSDWRAQMLIWQGKAGGIVVYSRDDSNRFKALQADRHGDRVDLGLECIADAPWQRRSSVERIEWRINAYRGGWETPARGYRALMRYLWPRSTPPDARLWINQIDSVVRVPHENAITFVGALARTKTPARTLLLLDRWSQSGPPDYSIAPQTADVISRARELGFYIGVSVEPLSVRVDWAELSKHRKWAARETETGDSLAAEGGRLRMSPSAVAWHAELVRLWKDAFAGARPDALLMMGLASCTNDGLGLVDGKNSLQGVVQLVKSVQTAFPDMVLGSDELHELIVPFVRLCPGHPRGDKPGHPLTDFLLSEDVLRFAWEPASGSR